MQNKVAPMTLPPHWMRFDACELIRMATTAVNMTSPIKTNVRQCRQSMHSDP